MECSLDKNKKRCTCTYEPCDKKGRCCECVSYHLKMNEIPGCFFSKEGEATYDRSIRRFIRDKG
ncbi:MAG: DUF6485 family protein [Syntrophorhabdaceae bacterium]|nr:DUF6485 family protein [Syntrophorhabdaceae bacterium]